MTGNMSYMPPVRMDRDGITRPESIDKVQDLVQWIKQQRGRIRVVGAKHATPNDKLGTDVPDDRHVLVSLDKIRDLTWPNGVTAGIAEVGAGNNLGVDPANKYSTEDNALLPRLAAQGWTLLGLAGITEQTVGGFLSTGSAGGSCSPGCSLERNLVGFTIVDGNGNVHRVEKGHKWYNAVGISMGLLGVVVSVTLQCSPAFKLIGREDFTGEDASECTVDLFGSGSNSGKQGPMEFFRSHQYSRIRWYPQSRQVGIWQADELDKSNTPATSLEQPDQKYVNPKSENAEAEALLMLIIGNLDDLTQLPERAKPLLARIEQLRKTTKKSHAEHMKDHKEHLQKKFGFTKRALGALMKIIDGLLMDDGKLLPQLSLLGKIVRKLILPSLGTHLKNFLPTGEQRTQHFYGNSWDILPLDNHADYQLVPMWFTELWFPASNCHKVMSALKDHFGHKRKIKETGLLCTVELYAAPKSEFLLSAASGGEAFRVDFYWAFGYGPTQNAVNYFQTFWKLLKQFEYKPHWGKFKPVDPAYLKARYGANWDSFMAIRKVRGTLT